MFDSRASSRVSTPRALVEQLERDARLPDDGAECFVGYGVMGLPFASGHVLGLRRWPASSLGAPYTSVWHRAPDGRWTFYTDVDPWLACPRYAGGAIDDARLAPIACTWTGPYDLTIEVPSAGIHWSVSLASTSVTRAFNLARRPLPGTALQPLPDAAFRPQAVLRALGTIASWSLGAGRIRLEGAMPNGQWFRVSPQRMWVVRASRAIVDGADAGPPWALARQLRLGDFWIPQRGLLAIAEACFAAFDPSQHLATTCRVAERAVVPDER